MAWMPWGGKFSKGSATPWPGERDSSACWRSVPGMGKNNQARRAAKSKARAKARARKAHESQAQDNQWHGPGDGGFGVGGSAAGAFDPVMLAAFCWRMAAQARHRQRPHAEAENLDRLRALPGSTATRGVEIFLSEHLEDLWAGGWQPAELLRQGRIGSSSAAAGRLVALAIAVDHANRRAQSLDHRWVAQVEGLDLPSTDGRSGWLEQWARAESHDRDPLYEIVVDLLANLLHLPALDVLIPPPGTLGVSGPAARSTLAAEPGVDPVLNRIRALLAKAESSTYEAEATSYTAKAQELMTKHAVDLARVQAVGGDPGRPTQIRVPVDAPYADAKSLLLQTVAGAGRCRAVYLGAVAMSSLVGYADDVRAVEMLFTSLLVQAQHALTATSGTAAPGTRTRSQSYRSAFLIAFSDRIGHRLREINQAVFTEAEEEHGSGFLPVLRSRSAAVEDFMTERFGDLVESRVRGGYDSAGWASGRIAADRAQLSFGELPDEFADATG